MVRASSETNRQPTRSPAAASSSAEPLQLKWRGTFIHVADQAAEEQAKSLRRSASDSDLVSVHSGSNFQEDQASVDQLADKLSSFWSLNAQRRAGPQDGEGGMSMDGGSQDLRPFLSEAQSASLAGLQGGDGVDASGNRVATPLVTPGYFGSMTPNSEVAMVAAATASAQSTLPETMQQEPLPSSISKSELMTKIHANIKEISRNVRFHQRQQALCSIQELPEQVEEVLNQSATSLLSEVQGKVAVVADMIRERDRSGDAEKAVESLEVISDMMKDSLEASVQKAKDVVREQIDDLVATVAETASTEEILKQVRSLPAQVQQIAGDYLWKAVVQSEKQATQQLDEVFERLPPEESDVLEGAKSVMAREVMARRFPAVASQARSAARLATLEPVQQAVAAVSAEDRDLQSTISNQVVADMLLRVKASRAEGALLSPRSLRNPRAHEGAPPNLQERAAAADAFASGVAAPPQVPEIFEPDESTKLFPAEPLPAEPLPAQPLPAEPLPAEPLPAEPLPAEPLPAEPLPAEPLPEHAPAPGEAFIGAALDLCGGNPGSIGHPDLCPRPCLFFTQGTCSNGSSCEFCHLPHPKRPAHLDKRHREMIKRMSLAQVGEMLLPILKEKIMALQQQHAQSLAFLQELANMCDCPGVLDDDRPQHRPSSAERLLLVALQAMSLRLLLTSMHRSIPLENVDARRQVDKLLNHLRVTSYRQLVEHVGGADDPEAMALLPVFTERL